MVVCVEASLGFFFRINSRPNWQKSLPLKKVPDHTFLDHDSYLECGDPLELDDYVVDESLSRSGIIGVISKEIVPEILKVVDTAARISPKDKAAIRAFLDPAGMYAQLPGTDRDGRV